MHSSATADPKRHLAEWQATFRAYVLDPQFPCVGARSALNRGRTEFGVYRSLGDEASARELSADLAAFSAKYEAPGAMPVTFIAMFEESVADEAAFTEALWFHLQALHDIDAREHRWDPTVSSDPRSASFSFSVAWRAFFVVGLSPESSRWASRLLKYFLER